MPLLLEGLLVDALLAFQRPHFDLVVVAGRFIAEGKNCSHFFARYLCCPFFLPDSSFPILISNESFLFFPFLFPPFTTLQFSSHPFDEELYISSIEDRTIRFSHSNINFLTVKVKEIDSKKYIYILFFYYKLIYKSCYLSLEGKSFTCWIDRLAK